MRVPLFAAILLALSAIAGASPIQEPIASKKQLETIGAKIETREYRDGSGISIQVSWKPHVGDREPFPPRLDLILYTKGREGQPAHATRRLQIRFSEMIDGQLHADFTVAPSELESVQLWFRESQQVHYYLALNELINGFPNPDMDPFADENNGEQDGADQPATASESKPEGKEQPKPESKVRPR